MPLFQCDGCGSLENTALSECGFGQMEFLLSKEEQAPYRERFGLNEDEPFGNYCSACCPLGNEEWHGEFDRVFLPKGAFETDEQGNLRHKETGDTDVREYAIRIEEY